MESNRQIYMERVNITEEELIEMLNNETFLTPEKAVEMGFADEVGKAETPAPDMTQQLQRQLSQMRCEMTAQKAFQEEMKQFCRTAQKKDDEDTDDGEKDDEDTDDTGSGDDGGKGTDDTDDEDDEDKKQKDTRKYKLAALIGQAAVQYLKGDKR